jgi:hypothetical protein
MTKWVSDLGFPVHYNISATIFQVSKEVEYQNHILETLAPEEFARSCCFAAVAALC